MNIGIVLVFTRNEEYKKRHNNFQRMTFINFML